MLEKTDINILEEKINIIRDSTDESCKYLVNVFNTYKSIVNKDLNKEVNIIKNKSNENIEFINELNDIQNVIDIKKNTTIVSFEKSNYNIEDYYKLIEKNSNLEILIISKNKYNLKTKNNKLTFMSCNKNSIVNKLNKSFNKVNDNNKNILVHLNMDSLYINSDWEINLIKNFEEILKKYNNYSISEIKKDKSNIALESIVLKNKVKKYFDDTKLRAEDVVKVLKAIVNKLEVKNNRKDNKKNNNTKNIKFVINTDDKLTYLDNIKLKEIITAIEILCIKNKKEQIEYLYDNLCSRIEKDLSNYKYCNFENDKCIAQRDSNNKNNYPVNSHNGCCYKVEKKQECERLKNNECTTKCISCRLFICKYLKDRGVSYELKDNFQVKMFLNLLQKPELVWNFFETREKILEKILRW